MHQFTGVAPVGLQEKGLLVTTATLADRVIEDALAPAIHEIKLFIAGQRLRKPVVVRRHVGVAIDTYRIHEEWVLVEQLLLQWRNGLIGEVIKTGLELLRSGIRDWLVAIIEQILAGVPDAHRNRVQIEVDRRRAIEHALEQASPLDVVLIAGKGHEDYQEVDGQRLPYSDLQAATEAFKAREPLG